MKQDGALVGIDRALTRHRQGIDRAFLGHRPGIDRALNMGI